MKKHYKFKLSELYCYAHALLENVTFTNAWCQIKDGVLTVNTGYAWDGCSHKINILGLMTIGTPDGSLYHGKPWTYDASLVHDVLCQFRRDIPLSKTQVTQLFDEMLKEVGWPLRKPYVWAVDHWGPQDFRV